MKSSIDHYLLFYLMRFLNILSWPAAWLMYHLADKHGTSRGCIEAILRKVFEPEAIRVALKCTSYDPDTGKVLLDIEGDDEYDHTDQVVANLDWMVQAVQERDTAYLSSNARQNGFLFDYDDFEDQASVDTNAWTRRRYPDNAEEDDLSTSRSVRGLDGIFALRNTTTHTSPGDSLSLGGNPDAPPARDAVVGQVV